MKKNIVAIICLVLSAAIIAYCGFVFGKRSQDPMKTRVADIVAESITQMQATYDNGMDAGKRIGREEGQASMWDSLGMHWLGSRQRFVGFMKEYGSIHNTPWNKFKVEEKFVIAIYGGSGSKLDVNEFQEAMLKYGDDEVVGFAKLADNYIK